MAWTQIDKKNDGIRGIKFDGVPKVNKYIAVAMIDRAGNLIVEEDGVPMHVASLSEHDQRVDTMSMELKFVIDQTEYDIRGGGVPGKFNYLVSDKEFDPQEKFVRRYTTNDLTRIFRNHDTYKREPLFFTGDRKFFETVLPYIDIVILTVVDTDVTETHNVTDKFPIELYKKFFQKRRDILSDLAEVNAKAKKGLRPDNREVEILNDYFKMIKHVAPVKRSGDQFYYKFIEFKR